MSEHQTPTTDELSEFSLHELEDWPSGARIVRTKGQKHQFKVSPLQPV